MPTKPKTNQPKTPNTLQERDFFQTPNYAVDLLLPHISKSLVIWECACGNNKIVNHLAELGFSVFGTDLQEGHSFFDYIPTQKFEMILTNVPFSLKKEFYNKAVEIGKPFALLMPIDFCGWILRAMRDDGAQWLVPDRRIDYITPTGKQGSTSSAQFHSGWFCYGMNLSQQITVVELTKEMKLNI